MDESRLIYPKCLTGDQASAGVATKLSDLRRTEATGFRPCTDGRTGGKAFPRTIFYLFCASIHAFQTHLK